MAATTTSVPIVPRSFTSGSAIFGRQDDMEQASPVMLQVSKSTTAWDPNLSGDDTTLTKNEISRRNFSAPIASSIVVQSEVKADSTPLQIWEGTVLDINHSAGVMQVLLDAKIGQIPRHTGEIDLDSVSPQDQDLVRPGAVFYLTLYKRTIPSVENIQELRFRRRPSWSTAQLKQIDEDAAMLLKKMKPLPSAT